ncbi:MAG: MFS transporter [Candidatus Borkfalkiaceae bacterium]|nr:MFS transporter [Christensenellaceae bacterium]
MKLNYKKTVFVGFAFFLICAFWQAYDAIVPMMLVNKFGLNQTLSGVIMSLDNVIALFLLPLFGSLSDKTKTRFGKRTPFIVLGTVVAVFAFFGLTFADNAQLAKLGEADSPAFYGELFEQNAEITNAEYSSIYNKSVPEKYTVREYASRIVYNRGYDELSDGEKETVKNWYKLINSEYFADHTRQETAYAYVEGVYYPVAYEQGVPRIRLLSENGEETWTDLSASEVRNVYTNLVAPARSRYAWEKTKSEPGAFVCFGGLLLLTLLAMATFRSPAVALMPDVTVKPLRSQANAVINLMGTAGGMLVLVLGMVFKTGKSFNQLMSYTWFVAAVCLLMIVGLLFFVWKVREPRWVREREEQDVGEENVTENDKAKGESGRRLTRSEKTSLILILLSVALWYIGYNAVTSKYSLYATNVLHKDYNATLLIAQAAAIVSYVPVGLLAGKIGRKKSILAGVVLLTAAFFGATFITSASSSLLLNVLFAMAGIGWATINVNSFPMVVELAGGDNVGKFTGYYYTASMAAQIATPVLSGLLMDAVGSMKPLFYYATFFAGLAIVTMAFVRHGDNKPGAKPLLERLDVDD